MEKHIFANTKKAAWIIGSFVGGSVLMQMFIYRPALLHLEVFGIDGNGGRMLKIITNLTDEEIARLKFVRRMYWHWKGSRKLDHGQDVIQTQELSDRGIEWPQEAYIEYEKRPPHDKYL